jgi:hypothetical protein
VYVLGFIPNVFSNIGQESDHIMMDFFFNFPDPRQVKICPLFDDLYRLFRNTAQFGCPSQAAISIFSQLLSLLSSDQNFPHGL